MATTTLSPAMGGRSHSGVRRICRPTGSFVPSTDKSVRSTPSRLPLLDERGRQILPGDDDMGLRLRDVSGDVRRRQNEAVAKINAITRP